MVNKTQFYKTKVALAVVLSLGLAACGDSDGDSSNATSNSVVEDNGGNTVEQVQGTGSVQGTVLDTNGLPVMGATVSLAAQTVVTDASGYYHFSNVAAPGVTGTNGDGNGVNSSTTAPYSVTITAPAGYASATVNVTAANIQVDSGNNGNVNGGQTEASGQQTTWFDGFLAQADTAVLPKYAAVVKGVLRNCNTGAALPANVTLALDFVEISGTGTANDSNVTVGVDTITTTTTADGSFSFENLPVDSAFSLTVQDYLFETTTDTTSTTLATSVQTTAEGIANNLGDFEVCAITSNDSVHPFISGVVSSIGSVTGPTTGVTDGYEYEVLSKGVDGTTGITLKFNEAMSAANFDASDVVVTKANDATGFASQVELDIALNEDGTPQVTLADNGLSMTVVLAAALPDEQRFSIWFPQWQYTDTSGNEIITGVNGTPTGATGELLTDNGNGDGTGSNSKGIISDMFSQETGKIGYIRTRLCTYVKPPETPEGLTGEQLVKTLDSSLLAVSPLWDNNGEGASPIISNLNGQENAVAGRDTGERIGTRFGETVINDTAVVVGSVQNASGVTGTVISGTGTVVPTTVASDGTFSLSVTDTAHGSEVLLTPTGSFGVSGTTVTVTLEDKVAPTTILQENYELWALEGLYDETTASGGTGAAGSGGEVTEGEVTGQDGDPVIYIQPRHLTPTNSANIAQRYTEFNAFDFSSKLVDGANNNPLYTGPAFAAWTGRGNSLGVAFSETIAEGSVAPSESVSVTLTLTDVLNGLTTDIDGNLIVGSTDTAGNTAIPKSGSDLARFTVSDMIAFANNDDEKAIDFTNGSIVDTQGNLANANSEARVVIRDAMPAFVTAARWDGSNIIIKFNETVNPKNGDDLILTDLVNPTTAASTVTLSSASFPATGAWSLNTAGDELTVAVDATTTSPLFQNGPSPANVFLFDSNGDTATENHLALNWDDIEDSEGNDWATFDRDVNGALTVDSDADTTNDRFGRYLVDAPRFMLYNDVGIFTITKQTIGYSDATASAAGDDDGLVTVRLSFSHPIDLGTTASPTNLGSKLNAAALGATFSGPSMTLAEANAILQLDLDGPAALFAPGNFLDTGLAFSATFSSDYKTIVINMAEAADTVIAGSAQVIFQDRVDSAITDEFLNNETYTVVNSQ